MTFATRLTKVGNGREHFDQRTRMCYHKVPPSERVVAQVGNAGQAKPHREHNPLSLLGARLATPIRKLNDPEALDSLLTAKPGLIETNYGRAVRDLVKVVWSYVFTYYFWLKESLADKTPSASSQAEQGA